jgi:glycerate 2-kinase
MSVKENQSSEFFKKAEKIYQAGIEEVKPDNLIKKYVLLKGEKLIVKDRNFDLSSFEKIYLVSFGKASQFMVQSLMEVFGNRIAEGIAVCKAQEELSIGNIICLPGSHPLPDEKSFMAARNVLSLVKKAGEKDLVLVLISGGGSALICHPLPGISLGEKRGITEKLLKVGADITELNTVRKHLSSIKGGRLAQEACPATVISLVISDVIGNDLENIASGPTHWDSSNYKDALQVLEKYSLWTSVSPSIRKIIEDGIQGNIGETLKKDNQVFNKVFNFIIGDNRVALQAAQEEAERLKFKSYILTSSDQGEARDTARYYISLVKDLLESGRMTSQPLCLLAGGELTVTVRGKGKGGRNQEFVLAALLEMKDRVEDSVLILSVGTDGIDGFTDAAGAWAVPSALKKAESLSIDPEEYLNNNDSYNFFKKVGGLIITGPTNTNVMDLRFFLVKK